VINVNLSGVTAYGIKKRSMLVTIKRF